LAPPAGAVFTENTIGCDGSAVITDDKGVTTNVNASDSTVKVPRKGSASYQGVVGTVTHNHFGEVKMKLAVFDIPLGSWGKSANAGNANKKVGVKKIPAAVEQLPAGKYVVSGFHQGDEGRCAGEVTVDLEGSLLSTPIGIVSAGGTLLTFLLMLFAAMAKGLVK
jgi:hypothetical protein